MNCWFIKKLITLYISGDLPCLVTLVESHIHSCHSCSQYYQQFQNIRTNICVHQETQQIVHQQAISMPQPQNITSTFDGLPAHIFANYTEDIFAKIEHENKNRPEEVFIPNNYVRDSIIWGYKSFWQREWKPVMALIVLGCISIIIPLFFYKNFDLITPLTTIVSAPNKQEISNNSAQQPTNPTPNTLVELQQPTNPAPNTLVELQQPTNPAPKPNNISREKNENLKHFSPKYEQYLTKNTPQHTPKNSSKIDNGTNSLQQDSPYSLPSIINYLEKASHHISTFSHQDSSWPLSHSTPLAEPNITDDDSTDTETNQFEPAESDQNHPNSLINTLPYGEILFNYNEKPNFKPNDFDPLEEETTIVPRAAF